MGSTFYTCIGWMMIGGVLLVAAFVGAILLARGMWLSSKRRDCDVECTAGCLMLVLGLLFGIPIMIISTVQLVHHLEPLWLGDPIIVEKES